MLARGRTIHRLLFLQVLVLAGGVVVSWTAVLLQFRQFFGLYHTIFRFADCRIPNPLVTACFWGALAFLGSFLWATRLVRFPVVPHQIYLRNFLIFCVVFGFSVLSYEFLDYYGIFRSRSGVVVCNPGVFPLKTPCFFGTLFFIAALRVASLLVHRMSAEKSSRRG